MTRARLPVEPAVADVGVLAAVGDRGHRGLGAGGRLLLLRLAHACTGTPLRPGHAPGSARARGEGRHLRLDVPAVARGVLPARAAPGRRAGVGGATAADHRGQRLVLRPAGPDSYRAWAAATPDGFVLVGQGRPVHHAHEEARRRPGAAGQLPRLRRARARAEARAGAVAAAADPRLRRRHGSRRSSGCCPGPRPRPPRSPSSTTPGSRGGLDHSTAPGGPPALRRSWSGPRQLPRPRASSPCAATTASPGRRRPTPPGAEGRRSTTSTASSSVRLYRRGCTVALDDVGRLRLAYTRPAPPDVSSSTRTSCGRAGRRGMAASGRRHDRPLLRRHDLQVREPAERRRRRARSAWTWGGLALAGPGTRDGAPRPAGGGPRTARTRQDTNPGQRRGRTPRDRPPQTWGPPTSGARP